MIFTSVGTTRGQNVVVVVVLELQIELNSNLMTMVSILNVQ